LFALCVESSHARGMGHLYRSMRFAQFLDKQSIPTIFFINDHAPSLILLKEYGFYYQIVTLLERGINWEREMIAKHGITTWVNDRLDTNVEHAGKVKREGIKLITFDDRGKGAALADLQIAGLLFGDRYTVQGKKILTGSNYLILNEEIDNYRHIRTELNRVVVSMGGSDTYNVTTRVVNILKAFSYKVTVIVGPGFEHLKPLQTILPKRFELKKWVPSLIQEFSMHDMAITGGGVTPFEACASGLPCIVIANERFEIDNAKFLERKGLCRFAGYYTDIDENIFNSSLDIQSMSKRGLEGFDTRGAERIFREIRRL